MISERGGSSGFASGIRIYMSAEEKLDRGSRRSSFQRPWVKKRGWVRLVLQRGVQACRERGQRWSKSAAFFSSSSHNKLGFPPFSSVIDHGVVLGALGGYGGGVGTEWG
jgi:hypothetical protein